MWILKGMRVSHRITDLHNFVCNSFIEEDTIWKKEGKKENSLNGPMMNRQKKFAAHALSTNMVNVYKIKSFYSFIYKDAHVMKSDSLFMWISHRGFHSQKLHFYLNDIQIW